MKLYLQNTQMGLIPLYDSDYDEKKKLKIDEVYLCEIKKARNYQFLKKFMALIRIGCDNSKTVDMPFDAYREYITIKAGFFEMYVTPKGKFVRAKSIAFENMEEEMFADVYNKVLDQIIIDTGATKEDIEKNLLSFM
jgi:hypothetical protein